MSKDLIHFFANIANNNYDFYFFSNLTGYLYIFKKN